MEFRAVLPKGWVERLFERAGVILESRNRLFFTDPLAGRRIRYGLAEVTFHEGGTLIPSAACRFQEFWRADFRKFWRV